MPPRTPRQSVLRRCHKWPEVPVGPSPHPGSSFYWVPRDLVPNRAPCGQASVSGSVVKETRLDTRMSLWRQMTKNSSQI